MINYYRELLKATAQVIDCSKMQPTFRPDAINTLLVFYLTVQKKNWRDLLRLCSLFCLSMSHPTSLKCSRGPRQDVLVWVGHSQHQLKGRGVLKTSNIIIEFENSILSYVNS